MQKNTENQPGGEVLLYQTEDGQTRLETRMTGDTVWLSLNQMAELFHRDKSVISRHIRNIFEEGELHSDATVAKFATVQTEGGKSVSRDIEYYSLDVIISVGYRVKSHRGVQFRIWATQRLREYIIKGFALDDERELEHTGTVKESLTVRQEGARQVSRDGECTEAATCKFYLQVRQEAGLGKVHQLFGDKLNTIIEELNEALAA
jgi:hypothetical protein